MSILEQCISYGNEDLTTDKISHLLGIIDEKVINEIVIHLFHKRLDKIIDIMKANEINDYSKLLDCIIERIFQLNFTSNKQKHT